ncbi:uncharacterized protein PSFLO_02675 [Pseudozyma flocculosa]|uniref:Uncharacterized protein n=1 Tax=Pseudozyma flocculosa TaxID=84751 RepID=A0A5C3EY60_9BASI|nr:uncharacterized protein PSFLO_02675 [Pseudozyma flocculosa]
MTYPTLVSSQSTAQAAHQEVRPGQAQPSQARSQNKGSCEASRPASGLQRIDTPIVVERGRLGWPKPSSAGLAQARNRMLAPLPCRRARDAWSGTPLCCPPCEILSRETLGLFCPRNSTSSLPSSSSSSSSSRLNTVMIESAATPCATPTLLDARTTRQFDNLRASAPISD